MKRAGVTALLLGLLLVSGANAKGVPQKEPGPKAKGKLYEWKAKDELAYHVTAFTARDHDAAQVVGYGKVAAIFHMLRAELGAQGRTGIEKAYSWPRIAAATAEVYAEAIAERHRR